MWEQWSDCPPCGAIGSVGTQRRTLTVTTPAAHGGNPCELEQSRDCNTQVKTCPALVDELAAHIGDGTCDSNLLYALQQDPAETAMIEPGPAQWPTFDEALRAGDTAMAAQRARGGARSSRQQPAGECDSIGHPEAVVHGSAGPYTIIPHTNEEYLRSWECYCTSNLLREMADCDGTMDVGTPHDITGQGGYLANWSAYRQHCDYWGQPDNQQEFMGQTIGRWPALR